MLGAVLPVSVPPRSTTLVDFLVPLGPGWHININGQEVLAGSYVDIPEALEAGDIVIEIDPDGGTSAHARNAAEVVTWSRGLI